MKNFQASAVERRITITGQFGSQPMEAGWASEAIFFIWVESISIPTELMVNAQISPDGINWIDEDAAKISISQPGYYAVKTVHFGNWLRVRGTVNDPDSELKLSVHLHLKG